MPGTTAARFLPIIVLTAALFAACSQASRLRGRCLSGEVAVCTQLGDMYARGTGVPRDLARATELYERACEMGAVEACNTLGEIYERGHELEGGLQRAEGLFRIACNGNSAAGCLNLGLALETRDDKKTAASLFERSCAAGLTAGCHHLAGALERGAGVLADLDRATALYQNACNEKYVDSCLALGALFLAGERTPRDAERARCWYGAALTIYRDRCGAGSVADCSERDKLRRIVTLTSQTQ